MRMPPGRRPTGWAARRRRTSRWRASRSMCSRETGCVRWGRGAVGPLPQGKAAGCRSPARLDRPRVGGCGGVRSGGFGEFRFASRSDRAISGFTPLDCSGIRCSPCRPLRAGTSGLPRRGPPGLSTPYGLTEATIDSTYFEGDLSTSDSSQPVPIGRPFAGTRVYVLDRRLEPVPVGVVGELHIGWRWCSCRRGVTWNRPVADGRAVRARCVRPPRLATLSLGGRPRLEAPRRPTSPLWVAVTTR